MSRRSRGEGSIFFDEVKQCYVGSTSVTMAGKRSRPKVYGQSRPEVLAKLRKLREAPQEASAQLTGTYLASWLKYIVDSGMKPKTYALYESYVRLYLIPLVGLVKLSELRAYHSHELFTKLREMGKSERIQALAHRVLSTALSYAKDPLKLIPYNPLFGVKTPRGAVKEIVTWTAEQVRAYFDGTKDEPRDHAFGVLAGTLGMREGELLGLQWPEVDVRGKTLKIEWNLVEIDGKIRGRYPPKSDKSRRVLLLTEECVSALARQREWLMARGLAACPWVFPTRFGDPQHRSNVLRDFKARAQALGLPILKVHGLRHTNATLLMDAGVNPKTVSERLGHSDVGITLRTYTHVNAAEQQRVSDVMVGLLETKK
jgi:integrase